jgi:signal transduction histidine kinase
MSRHHRCCKQKAVHLPSGLLAWLRWLAWLAWLPATWLTPALAQAGQPRHDAISARAWLSDPTGQLGPDQIRQMAWTPYADRLRLGYSGATTWVRLTVVPPDRDSRHQDRLVLRIQPGQLDEIALFDPRLSGQPPQLTGDRHDWRLGEYRSFNHNLVIAAPAAPTELLLRLRTTSHHAFDVQALTWDQAQQQDCDQQLLLGSFCAFVLMTLAWSGGSWWRTRERVFGVFFVQQAISTLFVFSLLGIFRVYLSDWLPAPLLDAITTWLFPLAQASTVWFHWHFLREFNPPRWGMRGLQALMALLPLEWLLLLAGQTSAALQLNVVAVSLTLLLLLGMVWRTTSPDRQATQLLSRRNLLTIYGLMLLTLGSATLPALGWLPSLPWGTSGVPLYAFVSALLVASALHARAKKLTAAHRQALTTLTLVQQQAAQERSRREEQEQFLAMLTHELATPLAVASLAIGGLSESSAMRARAYLAVDSMRGIIENCALAGQLDAPGHAPQRTSVDATALLHELRAQLQAKDPTGAHIALRLPDPLPPCQTDRIMLAVILGNLMSNALKYGAGSVTVTAQVQPRGPQAGLQFSVNNAAGAMGRPDPAHLFEKYHRGRAAMRQAGSGLGLYLSALTAKRLGGELVYRAEATEVCFELWLPA